MSNVKEASIRFEEIQESPQLQEWMFFYVIHGVIPEIMPNVAYRRVGAEELHKRKILKCPFCASRLTDMDIDTRVELYGHEKHVPTRCQFYIRCFCCHKEVVLTIFRDK